MITHTLSLSSYLFPHLSTPTSLPQPLQSHHPYLAPPTSSSLPLSAVSSRSTCWKIDSSCGALTPSGCRSPQSSTLAGVKVLVQAEPLALVLSVGHGRLAVVFGLVCCVPGHGLRELSTLGSLCYFNNMFSRFVSKHIAIASGLVSRCLELGPVLACMPRKPGIREGIAGGGTVRQGTARGGAARGGARRGEVQGALGQDVGKDVMEGGQARSRGGSEA